MVDLASLEVWKETAEDLATRAVKAEAGSVEQAMLTSVVLMFCAGEVTVEEIDELLNGD